MKYANNETSSAKGSYAARLYTTSNGKILHRGYKPHEIDALVVYLPCVDALCWFNTNDILGLSQLVIGVELPKNGQRTKDRMYHDYVW